MEYKVVEKGKGFLEIELDDKTTAGVLVSELNDSGVDAASFEPHPLFVGTRIRINAKDGEKALKAAITSLEKKITSLKKSVL